MLRVVKHIVIIALCLLVISGAVGTHVYVYACSQHHHATQLSLSDQDNCYCHSHCHEGCALDHNDCGDHCSINDDDSCCTSTSQVISVSNFEVSKIVKLDKVAVVAILFNALLHTCDNDCGHTQSLAYAPNVHSPHSPDIYSFGQLRL